MSSRVPRPQLRHLYRDEIRRVVAFSILGSLIPTGWWAYRSRVYDKKVDEWIRTIDPDKVYKRLKASGYLQHVPDE